MHRQSIHVPAGAEADPQRGLRSATASLRALQGGVWIPPPLRASPQTSPAVRCEKPTLFNIFQDWLRGNEAAKFRVKAAYIFQ